MGRGEGLQRGPTPAAPRGLSFFFYFGLGVGFRGRLGAGGDEAAADVAFETVGLLDDATGLDEAGGGVGDGDGLVGGEDTVGEGGELLGGFGAFGVGVCAGA